MSHAVFICHAHEDYATALGVCTKLEAGGVPCWIAPRDVGPGAYPSQLVGAITDASAILVLFSEKSNRSEHVLREIEIAASRHKAILPVKIENVSPNQDLEYFTSRVQWFDAVDTPLEQRYEELLHFVQRLIAAPSTAEATAVETAPGVAQSGLLPMTFAFTDVEDASAKWDRDWVTMQKAVERYDALLRAAVGNHGGSIFKTTGDACCSVFSRPQDAVAAMIEAQRAFATEAFSGVDGFDVRAAIHTGPANERDGGYSGPAVDRVTRLLAIAHGAQILASGVTQDIALGALPPQTAFKDLGAHRLKDLARPEQVYQVVAPGLSTDFPALRSLTALPNNLPMELTSFVGRDREVAEVTAVLNRHRLVTLAGSGGVGKTRLSLQVAANLLDGSGDGVWFIELAPLVDGSLIPVTIANLLGIPLSPEKDALTSLVTALASKTLLLVFDNCEHLVDAAATVIAALLHGAPKISILASSRQSLGVSGEETYRMPSLRVPSEDEIGELRAARAMTFGAIALFVERATSAEKRFALSDDNAPVVASIVRRLDGIALAIELAASRLKLLDVRQLNKRLDERFRILTGGGRDVLPRQQTLRALIDWSYDLLDEREKTLFARLGVFVDGFTLEAATSVCTDEQFDEFEVIDVLSSLADKSLVVAELSEESTRYQLLESTRAYALEKLEAAGDRHRISDRHLDWLVTATSDAREQRMMRMRLDTFETFRSERGNVRSAIAFARESGRYADGALIIFLLGSKEGLGFGGREWLDLARAFIDLTPPSESKTLAQLWGICAVIESHFRLITESLDSASRALVLARASDDAQVLFEALLRAADALVTRLRFEEADRLFDEVTPRLEGANPYQFFSYHIQRALALTLRGDIEGAVHHYNIVIDHGRSFGAAIQRHTYVYPNLAEIEYARGNIERAITVAREAAEAQRQSAPYVIYCNLTGYLTAADRLDEARESAGRALSLLPVDNGTNLIVIEHLALVAALEGDTERAARLAGFTSAALDEVGVIREYTERTGYERLRGLLADARSAEELTRLESEGRGYSWQDARNEAMRR